MFRFSFYAFEIMHRECVSKLNFYKILAPGAYSPEKVNLEHQPAFSFGSRPEEKINNIVPAPNQYQPEKCNLNHQSAFSFGVRPEIKIRSDSPAPNQYAPENCKLDFQPAFSFGGRHDIEKPNQTPGLEFQLIFLSFNQIDKIIEYLCF